VQLPLTFLYDGKEERGTVLNLSLQGCALTADNTPAVSTYLSLQIELAEGTAPIAIELAGIRWVAGRRCGLEFIRISPEMMAGLRDFVALLETTP